MYVALVIALNYNIKKFYNYCEYQYCHFGKYSGLDIGKKIGGFNLKFLAPLNSEPNLHSNYQFCSSNVAQSRAVSLTAGHSVFMSTNVSLFSGP